MQPRSLAIEPKYIAAHYGHDESFIVKCGYQQLLLLVHKGNNCTSSHSDLIHMLCDQEGIALPKTRDVSHIWDHVEPGRPLHLWTDGKGIFFRINTSPSVSTGSLTTLLRVAQSRKALLPIYFNEGGMASSNRAAQFIKALTRMVCSVGGKLTSLRLVQCANVNSWISSTFVLERSTCLSR